MINTTKVKNILHIKALLEEEGYILLTTEYRNQHDRLDYICPNGHERHTTWKDWKKGNRCLVCKNQRAKLSIEQVRQSFGNEGYTLLSEEYVNNKTKLEYLCPMEHKNSIIWGDWNTGGYRCPDCANNKKLSIDKISSDFNTEGYTFVSGDYKNNTSKLILRCPKGHEFVTSRVSWTSGNRCPTCYYDRINIDVVRESFSAQGYMLLSNNYIDAYTKLDYICDKGHRHSISWSAWQQGERCYYCRNLKNRIPIIDIIEMFKAENYTFIEDSYFKDKLEYICPEGHEGSVSLGNWKNRGVRCVVCSNNGSSQQEQSLVNYINCLGVRLDYRNRDLIAPKELDVVVKNNKIAIEYCGLYWHSELMDKNNDYHLDKLNKCNTKNYNLITIFEDEWLTKRSIVESRLKGLLGKTEKVIYARKTKVKEVSTQEARVFCEANHLQGYAGSRIKLGLFYSEELVSVMTFSKPSLSKGQKTPKEGVWELSRFCSKLNTSIVGGASKLLTYFRKNYEWEEIFSYADRRWSVGNLYNKLGFAFVGNTKPNYWYFKQGQIERIHRFALRKQPDEPKDVTEWELRKEQGYNRIWDCGNLKYVMHK